MNKSITGTENKPLIEYFKTGWHIVNKKALVYIGFLLIISVISFLIHLILKNHCIIESIIQSFFFSLITGGMIICLFSLVQASNIDFKSSMVNGLYFFNNFLILFLILNMPIDVIEFIVNDYMKSIYDPSYQITISIFMIIIYLIYGFFSVSLMFTPFLIVDKKLNYWEAMRLSYRFVSSNRRRWFSFAFIGTIVLIAGLLCLFIGLLIAGPVLFVATTLAYNDEFGIKSTL